MSDARLRQLERSARENLSWPEWLAWAGEKRRHGDEDPWRFGQALRRFERLCRLTDRVLGLALVQGTNFGERRARTLDEIAGRMIAPLHLCARLFPSASREGVMPPMSEHCVARIALMRRQWPKQFFRRHRHVPEDRGWGTCERPLCWNTVNHPDSVYCSEGCSIQDEGHSFRAPEPHAPEPHPGVEPELLVALDRLIEASRHGGSRWVWTWCGGKRIRLCFRRLEHPDRSFVVEVDGLRKSSPLEGRETSRSALADLLAEVLEELDP